MNGSNPRPSRNRAGLSAVGEILCRWREARRVSQFELSLTTGISARHLSYVETGRSHPSRELLELLADALAMPLRERNTLLLAAGFAPPYRETSLSAPELAKIRQAADFIIGQQEPYPAFIVNRYWDVLMMNAGLQRVFTLVRGGQPTHTNIMHQVFDPNDMRPHIVNWDEVAGDLLRHLHHQVSASAGDSKLRALRDEVLSYPGLPADWHRRELGATPLPVITTIFRAGEARLQFFSTITTFGSPLDVTVDEMHIECMFPMDEETAEICRALQHGTLLS